METHTNVESKQTKAFRGLNPQAGCCEAELCHSAATDGDHDGDDVPTF